jgi:hypothetical protein
MGPVWIGVCHPGRQKTSNGDLKSVRVKKSFRNDEISDSMAGSRASTVFARMPLLSCFDAFLTRTGVHHRIKSEGMLRSKTL